MFVMRVFIAAIILIFSFQSPSQADDIRDFQIEGISIGDSLLDHFSKKEVKDFFEIKYAVNYYPKSKKFFTLGTFSEGKIYKQILFGLKASDNKYIIYGVDGYKRMSYQDCVKESKLIISEIKQLFSKDKFSYRFYEKEHEGDASGNSIIFSHDFNFNSGDSIRVICTDWGKEMEADHYFDNIAVAIGAKEYDDWLENEAY